MVLLESLSEEQAVVLEVHLDLVLDVSVLRLDHVAVLVHLYGQKQQLLLDFSVPLEQDSTLHWACLANHSQTRLVARFGLLQVVLVRVVRVLEGIGLLVVVLVRGIGLVLERTVGAATFIEVIVRI